MYTGVAMPPSTRPTPLSPPPPSSVTPRQAARRPARLDTVLDLAFLRALAEPSRARLVSCLLKCGRPCSVSEIAECCDLDFSTVARHLSLLARSGVLTAEKRGRTVWYDAHAAGLARHFRDLADAIDDLDPSDGRCEPGDCGCDPTGANTTATATTNNNNTNTNNTNTNTNNPPGRGADA